MCPRRVSMFRSSPVLGVLLVAFVVASAGGSQQEPPFRAGVEVVNVTATVTDAPGNRALVTPDIRIERGHFRVPEAPGLGVVLDEKEISKYPSVKVA